MRSLTPVRARLTRRGLGALVGAALTLSAGCSFITGVPDVDHVKVELSPRVVAAGSVAQAIGTAYAKNGSVVSSTRVVLGFTSSDPAVATVQPNTGIINAVSQGSTVIKVTYRGKSDTATLTVTPMVPQRIDVNPGTVYVGSRTPLTITAYGANGQSLGKRPIANITSSNTNILTVEGDGTTTGTYLRGVAIGTALVTGSIDGAPFSFQVPVQPPEVKTIQAALQKGSNTILQGESAQIAVLLFDANNAPIPPNTEPLIFQSDDQTVATVNSQSGVVTGVKPGTANITVLLAGSPVTGKLQVTVAPIPARQVIFVNRNPFLRLDATGKGVQNQRSAVAYDSLGRAIPDRTIVYRSTDPSVFTVTQLGTVTPQQLGQALLIASADNGAVADTVKLTVTPVPILFVKVNPSQAQLYPGQTQQFSATLTDSLGVTITGRSIEWQSNAPSAASVNASTGLVTAKSPGTVTITAIVDQVPGLPLQVTGSGAVLVLPTPVDSIVVSPTKVTLAPGTSTLVSIKEIDAAGNQIFGRTGNISVQSDNPTVALGDNSGVIRAGTAGTAHLTYQALGFDASPEGKPTVVTVTVQAP